MIRENQNAYLRMKFKKEHVEKISRFVDLGFQSSYEKGDARFDGNTNSGY